MKPHSRQHLIYYLSPALLFLAVTTAINANSECHYDPVDKKYYSICETCEQAQIRKSDCPSFVKNLQKINEKIREKLEDLDKSPDKIFIRIEKFEEEHDLLDTSNSNNPSSNFYQISGSELLTKITNNLKIVTYQERQEELINLSKVNSFSEKAKSYFNAETLKGLANSEVFVTIMVLLFSVSYHYKIMTARQFLTIFFVVSYILTYHQQIELAKSKQINRYMNFGEPSDSQNFAQKNGLGSPKSRSKRGSASSNNDLTNDLNRDRDSYQEKSTTDIFLSYIFFWRSDTGYSEENYTNAQYSVKPLKVFFIMLTETFLEPFPIVARSLNEILRAAFDGLSIWLMPVMVLLIVTLLGLIWMFIFLKSGLTLRGRLLGGLLGDFSVGMEGSNKSIPLLTDSDKESEKISGPLSEKVEKLLKAQASITSDSNSSLAFFQQNTEKHMIILQSKISNLTLKLEEKELTENYHHQQALKYEKYHPHAAGHISHHNSHLGLQLAHGGAGDTLQVQNASASDRRRMFKTSCLSNRNSNKSSCKSIDSSDNNLDDHHPGPIIESNLKPGMGVSLRSSKNGRSFYFTENEITSNSFKNDLKDVKKQVGSCNCSLASLAHIIPDQTEQSLEKMLARNLVPDGMTLPDLFIFMQKKLGPESDIDSSHINIKNMSVCRPSDPTHLKKVIFDAFSMNKSIICNFYMAKVYDKQKNLEYGHFSPIVAYSDNKACLGDVWYEVPDFTWVEFDKLFRSIDTLDKDSMDKRGLIIFELAL